MSKRIDPDLKTIGKYLHLDEYTSFVIPEYQRAYSWTIDNCDKLWQDIVEYTENESRDNYFFGTIIISSEDDSEGNTRLCLIDGQQRTTTFLLLLKALLIRLNKAIETTQKEEESRKLHRGLQASRRAIMEILYRAEPEDISDEFDPETDKLICSDFSLLINNSINEQYDTELATIISALDFDEAEKSVFKIKYKRGDNRYTRFFKNFKFFCEKMDELSETETRMIAKAIIEQCEIIEVKSWQVDQAITMFNSLNSDGMPLQDADIISARLYACADSLGITDEFNDLWTRLLSASDDLSQKGIVSLDSLLLQKMYCERAATEGELVSDTGGVNVNTPGVRRYFTQINAELLKNPIEFVSKLLDLATLWSMVADMQIAKVLSKFNNNAKLFVAIYLSRFNGDERPKDEDLNMILESLMRLFAILEVVDAGYSSKHFKSFLFKESPKLADKDYPETKIQEDFDKHITATWDYETIREGIYECEKQSFVFLNEYLFARLTHRPFDISYQCDIEHIMPASGKNTQIIRQDAGIDSQEEFAETLNKLGNKILLEININRSIGNEWFRTKVSTTLEDKTGYIDSVYPLANALVDKYEFSDKIFWTKTDIEDATNKASARIASYILSGYM